MRSEIARPLCWASRRPSVSALERWLEIMTVAITATTMARSTSVIINSTSEKPARAVRGRAVGTAGTVMGLLSEVRNQLHRVRVHGLPRDVHGDQFHVGEVSGLGRDDPPPGERPLVLKGKGLAGRGRMRPVREVGIA